jgi:hypothetical protein
MPPQFKNMNELVEYLGIVEQRIEALEAENKQLRAITSSKPAVDGNLISKYVTHALPQTNLISPSFYKRAFAVWGHFFVANLIVSIIFTVIYICIVSVFFGSFFGSLIHNIPK